MSCVLMCANTISHITKERKHIHYSYMLVDPLLIDYIPTSIKTVPMTKTNETNFIKRYEKIVTLPMCIIL